MDHFLPKEKKSTGVSAPVAATHEDIPNIVKIINEEAKRSGAVLPVSAKEVKDWIDSGLSFISKNEDGELVAHQSAHIWPGCGWAELRAAVVLPEYRGEGLNGKLKDTVIEAIREKDQNIPIVSVKNNRSGGHNILLALGFVVIPDSDAPKELFKIGPADEKWQVYVLYPDAKEQLKAIERE